jgi:hypothetical protein
MEMAQPFNNITESRLIKQWMPRKRGETYIAGEQFDYQWSKDEVIEFIQMWNYGASVMWLQHHFKRTQNDIAVLILDLRSKGKIEPRDEGLWA